MPVPLPPLPPRAAAPSPSSFLPAKRAPSHPDPPAHAAPRCGDGDVPASPSSSPTQQQQPPPPPRSSQEEKEEKEKEAEKEEEKPDVENSKEELGK